MLADHGARQLFVSVQLKGDGRYQVKPNAEDGFAVIKLTRPCGGASLRLLPWNWLATDLGADPCRNTEKHLWRQRPAGLEQLGLLRGVLSNASCFSATARGASGGSMFHLNLDIMRQE